MCSTTNRHGSQAWLVRARSGLSYEVPVEREMGRDECFAGAGGCCDGTSLPANSMGERWMCDRTGRKLFPTVLGKYLGVQAPPRCEGRMSCRRGLKFEDADEFEGQSDDVCTLFRQRRSDWGNSAEPRGSDGSSQAVGYERGMPDDSGSELIRVREQPLGAGEQTRGGFDLCKHQWLAAALN